MQCLKVTFTELHEAEGAFGPESISPGGAVFPKHLVLSYDLETKTVVFPAEWSIVKGVSEGKSTDFYRYQFKFGDIYLLSVVAERLVSSIEFVEVDYSPDEFSSDGNLRVVTIRVPLEYRADVDKLIRKYRENNMVIGERSREGLDIRKVNGKKVSNLMWHYEVLFQLAGSSMGFFKELQEQIPGVTVYMAWGTDRIFPRQRAYYK